MHIIMSRMKRLISILIIILLFTMIFGLDYYLKKNNYLFYSNGTEEKAFIDATWGMSPNEVQRANNITLVPAKYGVFHWPDQAKAGYPRFLERYKLLEGENHITLWGFDTKVEYAFLDDKLFECTVFLDGYDSDKMHKIIASTLIKRYGDGAIEENRNYLHAMQWESNSERVEYWLLERQGKGGVKNFRAGVRTSYKPLMEIISQAKRGSTFWTWALKFLNAVLPAPD